MLECIPNVSEGARMEAVEALTAQLSGAPGLRLLDRSSDASHNRSVFTCAGDAAALLHRLPVNYVKIDGALMQGLANDRPLQERVKALVDVAREHGVTTIAERVEDANTMAVLWQLGIEFIQGYFVNSPERVVM